MQFEISARTILQLGSELISSDGISFYELIKNSLDARSPNVKVRVESRLPFENIVSTKKLLDAPLRDGETIEERVIRVKAIIGQSLDTLHEDFDLLRDQLQKANSLQQVQLFLDEANFIEFSDAGVGMTGDILRDVFLTVGTPFRLNEKESSEEVILGEKGIGRLSAIRLGKKLVVSSTQKEEPCWNLLTVDWRHFEDPDLLLKHVKIPPIQEVSKSDPNVQGTTIRISALNDEWTFKKLDEIASKDLCKFSDPFEPEEAFPISLEFNSLPVTIEILDDLLFEHAHARITAELCFCPQRAKEMTGVETVPVFFGTLYYDRFGQQDTFHENGEAFLHALGLTDDSRLHSLGSFTVTLYWFNRLYTTAVEGIGSIKQVRDLIKQWSGGLMVFRDGFRVQPYAGPDDDWLSLDRRAFSTGGFKLNRQQIIGKVDITTKGNPLLKDQTNREGISDCPEFRVFVKLLYRLLRQRFKPFLERVEAEVKLSNAISFHDLGDRFDAQKSKLDLAIQELKKVSKANPELGLQNLVSEFELLEEQILRTLSDAESIREGMEEQGSRFLRLAGSGLMVEILAHELHRSVNASTVALREAASLSDDRRISSILTSSQIQLESLAKRLSVLDRLTTSGRQRKKMIDGIKALQEIAYGRKDKLDKFGVAFEVDNRTQEEQFNFKFVEGMFYQLIENLIENATYWLNVKKEYDPGLEPVIRVAFLDSPKRIVVFDNGVGVAPGDSERIFLPFFSMREDDDGKGLGLYISREIAEYHGARLSMDHSVAAEDGRLHSFVLEFPNE